MKTPRYNFDLPALKAADRIMDTFLQGDQVSPTQIKAQIQVIIVDLLQEDHAGTHAELLEARQRAGRAEESNSYLRESSERAESALSQISHKASPWS